MRFTFKFLLSNVTTELLTFTANELADARRNAFAYSQLAFAPNEVMDFFLI